MPFKKGKSGNPHGRPTVILPQVKDLADHARNILKTTLIERVSPNVEKWIDRIIEQGIAEGDVVRFKMILEMALGKMIEDAPEFPLSEEEKVLVLEYRLRRKEQLERAITGDDPLS